MIDIQKVQDYAETLKTAIPEIKKTTIVVDDSQLSKELAELSPGETILVAFIPSHQIDGTNADVAMCTDFMLWLVLNKIDRNDGSAEFLLKMKLAQSMTKKIIKKMLDDKSDIMQTCGLMKFLQVPSIKADPIWALNSCDGYEINYSIKNKLY
jgi:hypothetical protein